MIGDGLKNTRKEVDILEKLIYQRDYKNALRVARHNEQIIKRVHLDLLIELYVHLKTRCEDVLSLELLGYIAKTQHATYFCEFLKKMSYDWESAKRKS